MSLEQFSIIDFIILSIMAIASCGFLIDKTMRKKKSVIILTVIGWLLISGAYIGGAPLEAKIFVTLLATPIFLLALKSISDLRTYRV